MTLCIPKLRKVSGNRPVKRYFQKQAAQKKEFLKKYFPLSRRARQLQEEMDLLTSYSSDTVYRLRYDSMTYDYISPAVIKLLGFTPEEMRKINVRSLIVQTKIIKDSISAVDSYASLEQARKNGDVNKWQADYLMRTKDGRKIWVMDVSFPWFDETGKIIGSVGSLRDITGRIEAEENAKEEVVRLAYSDLLTGLANRHCFFEHVDRELKRIRRSNSHFSILLIDVDHFKAVNDTYGHNVGDKVLAQMGAVILGCLRDTDVAARIGGEEFGVFLPDTSEGGAYWVAERICLEIAKHGFHVAEAPLPVNCTVSIGTASTEGNRHISSSELYKKADTRLYIAKNTGRNQVSVDEIVQMH